MSRRTSNALFLVVSLALILLLGQLRARFQSAPEPDETTAPLTASVEIKLPSPLVPWQGSFTQGAAIQTVSGHGPASLPVTDTRPGTMVSVSIQKGDDGPWVLWVCLRVAGRAEHCEWTDRPYGTVAFTDQF